MSQITSAGIPQHHTFSRQQKNSPLKDWDPFSDYILSFLYMIMFLLLVRIRCYGWFFHILAAVAVMYFWRKRTSNCQAAEGWLRVFIISLVMATDAKWHIQDIARAAVISWSPDLYDILCFAFITPVLLRILSLIMYNNWLYSTYSKEIEHVESSKV